jgi:pyrroline-5-carboxylate reductase
VYRHRREGREARLAGNGIGIIGFGSIGSVIYERARVSHHVAVFEKDPSKLNGIEPSAVGRDAADVVRRSDTVVLAVKPQDYECVLPQVKSHVDGKLIISLAAGIPTEHVEQCLGEVAVVRAMPNMPARIGRAITCMAAGRFVASEDLALAQQMFETLGETIVLREDLMDAATATSGSGPAFYAYIVQFRSAEYGRSPDRAAASVGGLAPIAADAGSVLARFIVEMAAACENVGFTREQALLLSTATASGTDCLLRETGLSPEDLRRQVATKGGTAEAGLRVLEADGSLNDAVAAALARGRELARSV